MASFFEPPKAALEDETRVLSILAVGPYRAIPKGIYVRVVFGLCSGTFAFICLARSKSAIGLQFKESAQHPGADVRPPDL